eukprot:Nk52_evm86s226 gene=Nk52_evmTU86s226
MGIIGVVVDSLPPPGYVITAFMMALTLFNSWPLLSSALDQTEAAKQHSWEMYMIAAYDCLCVLGCMMLFVIGGDVTQKEEFCAGPEGDEISSFANTEDSKRK